MPVSQWLAVEDIWLFGLKLDLIGACVLASGLLIPASARLDLSKTYIGYNGHAAASRAEDWAKGAVGVGLLVSGFLAQGIGHLVTLGNVSPDTHDHFHVFGGLISLGVASLAAVLVFTFAQTPLVKSELLQIAAIRLDGEALPYPDLEALRLLGRTRWPAIDGESAAAYAPAGI